MAKIIKFTEKIDRAQKKNERVWNGLKRVWVGVPNRCYQTGETGENAGEKYGWNNEKNEKKREARQTAYLVGEKNRQFPFFFYYWFLLKLC